MYIYSNIYIYRGSREVGKQHNGNFDGDLRSELCGISQWMNGFINHCALKIIIVG